GAAGQVDDAAEALLGHVRLGRPAHQEGAAQVHVHHGVPVLLGHLEQEVVPDDAGVVDQDHRRAEPLGDGGDGRGHLVGVGDVGADADGFAAVGGDGVRGLLRVGLVEVDDADRTALGGEPAGGGGA